MGAKWISWKLEEKQDFCIVSKYPPHAPATKVIINCEGKYSHFIVEKPRRYHFNQMMNTDITSNKISVSCFPEGW